MNSRDWKDAELKAIVADYFAMLSKERRGEPYVKARHRRHLQTQLPHRSEGAIEMKHCNISAVLDELSIPYIIGYKPRRNLQRSLRAAVEEHVQRTGILDTRAEPRR